MTGHHFGLRSYQGPAGEPAAWMTSRACTSADAELFHTHTSAFTEATAAPAKKICARCPDETKAACLAFGIAAGDRWGIYGGLTPDERQGHRLLPVVEPTAKSADRYLQCGYGHPQSPGNAGRDSRGYRVCQECKRIRSRARDAERRGTVRHAPVAELRAVSR